MNEKKEVNILEHIAKALIKHYNPFIYIEEKYNSIVGGIINLNHIPEFQSQSISYYKTRLFEYKEHIKTNIKYLVSTGKIQELMLKDFNEILDNKSVSDIITYYTAIHPNESIKGKKEFAKEMNQFYKLCSSHDYSSQIIFQMFRIHLNNVDTYTQLVSSIMTQFLDKGKANANNNSEKSIYSVYVIKTEGHNTRKKFNYVLKKDNSTIISKQYPNFNLLSRMIVLDTKQEKSDINLFMFDDKEKTLADKLMVPYPNLSLNFY